MPYGYGLLVHKRGLIFHNGGINGFVSYLGSLLGQDATVAVLSNVINADPMGIAEGLFAILKGEPYDLPTNKAAIVVAPEVLARYVGTYQVTSEFQVVVTVESEQLHIQGTGQPMIPLHPASENEFFARVLEFSIVFTRTLNGTVDSATLLQNGQELPASKVS